MRPRARDKHQAIWDMATVFNQELRALAAAGCRAIQIEEPTIHFTAATSNDRGELDFLVEAFNHEISGLEDVEVWVHCCWGNPNMQKVMEETSYANSVELYMERVDADVWTIEIKDSGLPTLQLFDRYRGQMPKKVALGVVNHRTLQVESPEEVAAGVREALQHIDPEHLVLTSNCGFGRQGCNRAIAFYKASAIAQGANLVRRELGFPEAPVRAAEPALQIDAPLEAEART